MKKYKSMRDLIVSNIKQFIIFLQERGTTIDTQCVIDKKKKTVTQQIDIKQELDSIGSNYIGVNASEMEFLYSETFCHQQELIQEIDYIFTVNEILTSVVSALIHVSRRDKSYGIQISTKSSNNLFLMIVNDYFYYLYCFFRKFKSLFKYFRN